MKVASSTSQRATSSASLRMRAQTGSTLSRALAAFVCSRAMAGSPAIAFHRLPLPLAQMQGGYKSKRLSSQWLNVAKSSALRQEGQHTRFESLVADRQHVVAAGNVERATIREQRRERLGGARYLVPRADRDQRRHADRRHVGAAQDLPRAADAGSKRLEVGPGLFGKGAKDLALGIGHGGERRRFEGIGNRFRATDALAQAVAEPAEYDAADAGWMGERQERCNARAHRIADHVGAADPKMVNERARVLGHDGAVVGGRIVALGGGAVAAVIESDRAPAGPPPGRPPAGIDPIDGGARGKAVNEHHRLALALVEKGDVDTVVAEALHRVRGAGARSAGCHRGETQPLAGKARPAALAIAFGRALGGPFHRRAGTP